MIGPSRVCGSVVPRNTIFHIAKHDAENEDVYLSHEHFGSRGAAEAQVANELAADPNGTYTVEEYRRVQ